MSLAHALTRQHGGDWYGSYGRIPTPGHSKRDRGTILHDRADGKGVLVNVMQPQHDWREIRDALGVRADQARPMTARERRDLWRQRVREKEQREGRQLAQCHNLREDGVTPEPDGFVWGGYLRSRGLPQPTIAQAVNDGALLEHRDHRGRVSMLALARNRNGVLRGVQMTRLAPDGRGKRGTDCDRLTFGPYKGSACRLLKPAGDTLAVAEGVETALAFAALRNLPTWATFGTANLEAFEPPAGIRRLVIAADGDVPGHHAAQALFDRLKKRIRCVIAAAPADLDWLDVLNQGGAPCP